MKELLGDYKLVLGLEIHLQLNTQRKMFCGCINRPFGVDPNTFVCPTCLGLPGALPVPNFEAIQKAQLLGLALGCRINESSKFDRKHYFYPDLPKGYQISQYKNPLCENGYIELDSGEKAEIERVHLEEDTAKSFHKKGKTYIDFNKSGIPLVEVVSEPCFTTIEDAIDYSKKLQDLVRYIGVSDADMEKGQFRIEPNISLRTPEMERDSQLPEYKVEIKNINSFKFMERAVRAEIARQKDILDAGEMPVQENRGYDEIKKTTVAQRSKEEAKDYRYFPEPDIPPLVFEEEDISHLKEQLPELPREIKDRLISQYGLKQSVAIQMSTYPLLDNLAVFEEVVAQNIGPVEVVNLLINKKEFRSLSSNDFVKKMNFASDVISDEEQVSEIVDKILSENSGAVESYKSGKENALQFLLGQVMRATKGKADNGVVRKLLKDKLN